MSAVSALLLAASAAMPTGAALEQLMVEEAQAAAAVPQMIIFEPIEAVLHYSIHFIVVEPEPSPELLTIGAGEAPPTGLLLVQDIRIEPFGSLEPVSGTVPKPD